MIPSQSFVRVGLRAPRRIVIGVAAATVAMATILAALALGQGAHPPAAATAPVAAPAPGHRMNGHITSTTLSPETDAGADLRYPVSIALNAPDPALRPGMTARVSVTQAQGARP